MCTTPSGQASGWRPAIWGKPLSTLPSWASCASGASRASAPVSCASCASASAPGLPFSFPHSASPLLLHPRVWGGGGRLKFFSPFWKDVLGFTPYALEAVTGFRPHFAVFLVPKKDGVSRPIHVKTLNGVMDSSFFGVRSVVDVRHALRSGAWVASSDLGDIPLHPSILCFMCFRCSDASGASRASASVSWASCASASGAS
jgi:hypothetical protein